MAIATNLFEKCVPAIGTDIKRCGTVTACNIATATADTLADIFTNDDGDFRNMQSLLVSQFELKACGTRVNGLWEFLMANSRVKTKSLRKLPMDDFQTKFNVEPFIMADQQSVINTNYWLFDNGSDPGGTPDWQVDAYSNQGIPLDIRWFNTKTVVFANGVSSGGSVTRTMYRVLGAEVVGARVRLSLAAMNSSFTAAAKVENPTEGFMTRGANNVSDFDSFCEQIPGLNGLKSVPFYIQTSRYTTCWDEFYGGYFADLQKSNAFFAKFGDIPLAKLNAQIYTDFQRTQMEALFWNKRISSNQTLNLYRSLDNIETASSGDLYLPNEGRCVGKRANAIGWYEQLAECGRVFDLQGNTLNLHELFELIYSLSRSRSDNGGNGETIDVFTDRTTRANLQRAFIAYFKNESIDTMRMNTEFALKGDLGFTYDRYHLINPAGVTLNVVTHHFFDDMKATAQAGGVDRAGNVLWFLDFNTMYLGLIDSNRVESRTGDIKDLSKISTGWACVMKNAIQTVQMNSVTWTAIVECPANSVILEGFNDEVPDHTGKSGSYDDYYTAV